MGKTHFIAGSGEHGCLYDQCGAYRDLEGAVESMSSLFGLGRNRRRELKDTFYLELNPRRDGASYVEITECECDEPWLHSDHQDDPSNWQD